MPELTAQPCVLVFVIVILLVGVAALLLRLDEVDRFHNGRRSNEWRWTGVTMLGVLVGAVVAQGVLLIWAREGQC